MAVQSYRDLQAWQKAVDFAVSIYRTTSVFPKEELYGLVSQIRRAAVSVAANIAEGQGRNTTKDFLKFLANARGSLNEIESHLAIARRLEYISNDDEQHQLTLTNELGRILNGLIRSLEARLERQSSDH